MLKIILFQILPQIYLSLINLSPYAYPHPESEKSSYYTISIFQTNDIHGYVFPIENIDPRTSEKYYRGGVEYISTYIKILKKEWKERFIWFDVGDSFNGGGLENFISKGQILLDFRIALCFLPSLFLISDARSACCLCRAAN